MANESIVAARARWVELIEQIHSPSVDDDTWTGPIVASMRNVFPRAIDVVFYAVEHSPDVARIEARYATASAHSALSAAIDMDDECRQRTFLAAHYTSPVITNRTVEKIVAARSSAPMRAILRRFGFDDAISLVAHPAPGTVVVAAAMFERKVVLDRRERELLTRVVLHLETGYRARKYPASIRAEIDGRGRLVRHDDRPAGGERLTAHIRRIDSARSRAQRESFDAVTLWPALIAGTLTVAPRPNGGYFLLDNPPGRRAVRALDADEAALIALLARGVSNKMAAYAFGVATSTISERLGTIAAKVGVASRTELLRVAALLGGDPRAELSTETLTAAEREVLALVERGLSNDAISRLRGRSVRTIANQVASLLRKTGELSRRSLAARAMPTVHEEG